MKISELNLVYKKQYPAGEKQIFNSRNTFDMLKAFYNKNTVEYSEEMICIYFDHALKAISFFRVSTGGITETTADIRKIIAGALLSGATGLTISHNHPAGYIEPSSSDISFTKKLNRACKLMDLKLFDHIIFHPEKYYSFKDKTNILK